MEKLVFATNNLNKLKEIRHLLKDGFDVVGLKELGFNGDIPEDHFTLEENALQKAEFIYSSYGLSCFADDTGLEIDALGGEPGVFSARYSRMGDEQYPDLEVSEGNIKKVLNRLEGASNRSARFRTVIALIYNDKRYSFEGVVEGSVTFSKKGIDGFGYDPVFLPADYDMTFAEMDLALKNKISHRARAVKHLVAFLNSSEHLG